MSSVWPDKHSMLKGAVDMNDVSEMDQTMDFLVRRRARGAAPGWYSDLFERLVWIVDEDESSRILAVLARWLRSEDLFKVEIALGIEGIFLFSEHEAMTEAYGSAAERWPRLKERCNQVLDEWARVHRLKGAKDG